jgi:hypothetical protein
MIGSVARGSERGSVWALVHFQTEGEMAPPPSCFAVTGWRRTESGRARGFAAQQTEAAIGIAALNRMLAAGCPESVRRQAVIT